MTNTDQINESDSHGSVKLVSITQGDMQNVTKKQLSWSDFNALLEQSRAEKNELMDRIESLEQKVEGDEANKETDNLLGERESQLENEIKDNDEISEEEDEDIFELPESTYTLFITEPFFSFSFFGALVAAAMALFALTVTLINEFGKGEKGNPFGVAPGVNPEVRMAQYLGVIIGVLMESEIPLALEVISYGLEQDRSRGGAFPMSRIFFSCILRLAVGYMFLLALFLTVVQEADVLNVFFDVLALEFVENIDDALYELFKRGFFGRAVKRATNKTHCFHTLDDKTRSYKKGANRFIRVVYLLNGALILAALSVFSFEQQNGEYRCQSFEVSFGDGFWEGAYVKLEDGTIEKRLLIYSHFNGIYEESDSPHNGHPRYVEMNKEDGRPFAKTIPAEIVFCEDIGAWVFRHDLIRTSPADFDQDEEIDCNWLLTSPEIAGEDFEYDLVSLSLSPWSVWTGEITDGYEIRVTCNECENDAQCNYYGKCEYDQKCNCDEDHFGSHCQFERPCNVIRSEKDNNTVLNIVPDPHDNEVNFLEIYGRPLYKIENLAGKPNGLLRLEYPDDDDKHFSVSHNSTEDIGEVLTPHKHYHSDFFTDDDFFQLNNVTPAFNHLLENYTFLLGYTGSRWYGQIRPPGWSEVIDEEEFHAFWRNTFSGVGQEDNKTLIISAPSTEGSPVGIDFFELRRRNIAFEGGIYDYAYGPFGVQIPLVSFEGSGFFHCNIDDDN